MKLSSSLCLSLSLYLGSTQAQRPQSFPGVEVVQSKLGKGITLSFKEPGICETNKGVKSYSGYIHLPPRTLAPFNISQNYPINLFYWYFQARKNPQDAPLALWMNGGPGASSFRGLLRENGPCSVNADSNSTTNNPFSWNEVSNMIYIDQPVQTGLSYDILQNGKLDLFTGALTDPKTPPSLTILPGTFPSINANSTTNTTSNSARALYYALQVFLQDAPFHKTTDTRFSIWTESYGGKYGPTYSDFILDQNKLIASNQESGNKAFKKINLDTLGIVNGCVDVIDEIPGRLQFLYNNTYNVREINLTQYNEAISTFNKPGGCKDVLLNKYSVEARYDPINQGGNASVNALFTGDASRPCGEHIFETVFPGRDRLDIGGPPQNPFPPPYFYGFLGRKWVLDALGAPRNYTDFVDSIDKAFVATGDYSRGGRLEALGRVLDSGVKVAFVFGDRDPTCTWTHADVTAGKLKYRESAGYKSAGYAPFKTNSTYNGGLVRQHNNLSFTRVYQAGHEIPAYQPQTALEIFRRVTFNLDVPTGTSSSLKFTSSGSSDPFGEKMKLAKLAKPVCYLYALESTCLPKTLEALRDGKAKVDNKFIVTAL